jgi:hypothetical protein
MIRLQVSGFKRLVVERVGRGPRGGELVSVAHYGEMNGDLMRDPEIVFEVAAGSWHPVSIQMDYTGSYREAVSVGEDGEVYVRPALVSDIAAFDRVWVRNLKHQGFVDAAEELHRISTPREVEIVAWGAYNFGGLLPSDDRDPPGFRDGLAGQSCLSTRPECRQPRVESRAFPDARSLAP